MCAMPLLEKNYRIRYCNTPPFTSPLVLIALRLSVVMTQTTADIPIMTMLCRIPACATTQESLKNSITPHMFSRHGMRTPWIHPNFIPTWPCWPAMLPTCPVSTALASWKRYLFRNTSCVVQFELRRRSNYTYKILLNKHDLIKHDLLSVLFALCNNISKNNPANLDCAFQSN